MAEAEVRCPTCGSPNVYWMTVLPRKEAEFVSKRTGNKLALKLARPRLFDLNGGEHRCAADDLVKDFD